MITKSAAKKLTWIFIVSLILSHAVFAEEEKPAPVSIENLAIPPALGKIEDRFSGKIGRWIIHIQDVHAHQVAQENIAALLDHLNAVYGIKTVALEGGWKSTSFATSWGIATSQKKQMLAQGLLENGYFTGTAYAAVFSQSPITLTGIENAELYEENRKIYVKHLEGREKTLGQIESFSKKMADTKGTVFNPVLQEFDRALGQFREGKKAEKFLPSLVSSAESKGVDLSDLTQVLLFKKVLQIEQSINKDKLQSEAKRLMEPEKNKRLSFEELLRNGTFPPEKLEYYPEAKKYLELMKLQDQISHRTFFAEIEEAIQRLKSKLFVSEEEKLLDVKSERFLLAKKFLVFQATPDDLTAYEAQKTAIDAELTEAGLSESMALALQFYDTAKKRDEIFFEKITTDPALSGNIVVVTGGFHTAGLGQRLRDAGISTIIITPDLAGQPANENLYFKRLQLAPVTAIQTLPPYNGFEDNGDQRFAEALAIFNDHNNLLEAETIAEGPYHVETGGAKAVSSGTTAVAQTVDFNLEEFPNLSEDVQKGKMKEWIQLVQNGKLPIVLILKTSSLQEIFKTKGGLGLFQQAIATDRANTIGEVRDHQEYLTELIGIKAHVIRIINPEKYGGMDGIIDTKFKPEKEKRVIAVIDPDYKTNESILGLPVNPASLLIARLVLEYGFPKTINAELQTLLEDVLRKVLTESAQVEQAA